MPFPCPQCDPSAPATMPPCYPTATTPLVRLGWSFSFFFSPRFSFIFFKTGNISQKECSWDQRYMNHGPLRSRPGRKPGPRQGLHESLLVLLRAVCALAARLALARPRARARARPARCVARAGHRSLFFFLFFFCLFVASGSLLLLFVRLLPYVSTWDANRYGSDLRRSEERRVGKECRN